MDYRAMKDRSHVTHAHQEVMDRRNLPCKVQDLEKSFFRKNYQLVACRRPFPGFQV